LNNQLDWEENGKKPDFTENRENVRFPGTGMRIRMNRWKRKAVGLKRQFPFISKAYNYTNLFNRRGRT